MQPFMPNPHAAKFRSEPERQHAPEPQKPAEQEPPVAPHCHQHSSPLLSSGKGVDAGGKHAAHEEQAREVHAHFVDQGEGWRLHQPAQRPGGGGGGGGGRAKGDGDGDCGGGGAGGVGGGGRGGGDGGGGALVGTTMHCPIGAGGGEGGNGG